MKRLYARLVLWLIAPALALRDERRPWSQVSGKISRLSDDADMLHKIVNGPPIDRFPEADSS